ncbi:hypothetical protein KKD19_01910 [Patescibacteria group bacterium]|nr:hypothetical protein [Patescibacteria group bacterium]MBU4511981.1 hypothetical protein [Patescibacteria group bacterium]
MSKAATLSLQGGQRSDQSNPIFNVVNDIDCYVVRNDRNDYSLAEIL